MNAKIKTPQEHYEDPSTVPVEWREPSPTARAIVSMCHMGWCYSDSMKCAADIDLCPSDLLERIAESMPSWDDKTRRDMLQTLIESAQTQKDDPKEET